MPSSPAAPAAAAAAAASRLRHPPRAALVSARWLRIRLRAPDGGGGGGGRRRSSSPIAALAAEGPSCLFVGPIETASKEMLEALYRQARDSYYSGKPLIGDDMFDKVELKLRLYGSKSVVKYPRCSLRRQSTYADAEEDPSQVLALASIWLLLLLFGTSAFLVPTIYTTILAFEDTFGARYALHYENSPFEMLTVVNGMLLIGLGYLVGYPVASASVQALQRLVRNDLVALKGSCPNCGEEVFAFVKTDTSSREPHRAECHVCESILEYRTKVEQSLSSPSKRWVYGRVYLVRRKRRRWM